MRSRRRLVALWLIAILAGLDVVGAAFLHEAWKKRHAELNEAGRPQTSRLNASDHQRASTESGIPSTR